MMTLTKISKILTQLPWIKGHFAVSKAQKKGSMGNYYTYTIVLHNLETREKVFQVLVKPFRDLLKLDKTKTKEKFLQWMSYIFFMYDPRSNYNYISDLAQRKYEIVTQEGLGKDFKEFDKLKEAIEYYKKLTMTSSTLLIEDTRMAIDKLRAFLRDFDLTEMDDRGKPVYTINTITSAIKQIPQLAQDLAKAEKVITKEIEEIR